MKSSSLRLLLNIVLFQLGWFACITLSLSWVIVSVGFILAVHFLYIVPRSSTALEFSVLCKVFCVGLIVELLYLRLGVLIRDDGLLFPPVWLLLLWVLFATTLRHSLSWLAHRPYLSAAFAAIAGPLSYYAGTKLTSQMSFNGSIVYSLVGISLSWAIVFPIFMRYLVAKVNSSSLTNSAH